MKRFKEAILVSIAALAVSCNGSNSGSGTSELQGSTDPDTEIIPISLSDDLTEVNGEILNLEKALWSECQVNCSVPNVKKLITKNKVNSLPLKNMIFGFDEMGGYSWNKTKYFGTKTTKVFLENLLKDHILNFNLNKLCALNEMLPKGLDGRFLVGEFIVNSADFPIQDKCGVTGASLNLDGTIIVQNITNGSFEKQIQFNDGEILLGYNPDKFVFGEFSPTLRKRLTLDKVGKILSVETLELNSGEDNLVRVFYDGLTDKLSLLANHTASQSVQFTLAVELGFEKLNIRATSLGGVETNSPQAVGCIDLSNGKISEFGYSTCPIDFGLGINESNPDLFVLNYTPISSSKEELDFLVEQDIFQNEI